MDPARRKVAWVSAFASVAWLTLSWAAISNDFRVDRTNQVSSVRFGRDHFDFTYTVDVTNSGPARSAVRATVTSRSTSTQILDGTVVLGNVAAGASLRSTDTFSFRQNRTVPFNPADLVWVFEYNAPPTLAPIAAQQVTVGQTLSLQLLGADSEGAVTYAYAPPLANASLDTSSGLFTFAPTAAQVGPRELTFTVSDGSLSASATTTITVVRGNASPVISSSAVTVATAGALYSYDVEASDADGDTLIYALTTAPAGMSINAASGLIQWLPGSTQLGPHDVSVRVSDGHGGSAEQAFVVTVSAPANRPPAITSTPVLQASVNVAYAYDVEANDPDGDSLTYSLTSAPAGMTIQSGSGLIGWQPSANQSGAHPVTVRVVDGRSGEDTQSFQVIVAEAPPLNQSPAILAISDKTVYVGQTLNFTVLASDPEGAALDYSFAPALANATLNDNGQFSFTPTQAQVGEHELTVSVSDETHTVSSSVRILVRGQNRAPTITSSPVTSAIDGQAYHYAVVASDLDGDALLFTLPAAPSGMTIQSSSGAISWTPGAAQTGDRAVTVRATDPSGAFDEQEFTVEVAASADRVAPVVTLTAPSAAMVDTQVLVLAAAFDDVAVVRVAWYVGNTLIEQDTQPPYRLTYAMPATAGASLAVRAVAFDAAGNQGEDAASILAVATPDTTPPVIDAIKLPPTAAPGELTTVRAKVRDDRGIANVGFSRAGTPLGIVELEPYEVRFTVPSNAPIGSQVTITVVARDTSDNEATGQASLTVVGTPDTVAPTAVTVNSPPTAQAGQNIPITATAVDAGGVFKVQFFVHGVLFADDFEAPYEVEYAIAETAAAGTQFKFVARALDFSGNGTNSAPDKTEIVAGAEGVITGEVYDDSVGLALGAVTVEVLRAGGRSLAPVQTVAADASGRYQLTLPEGETLLRLSKTGFTTSYRQINVVAGRVNVPLDGRLRPLAAVRSVNPVAGTEIVVEGTALRIPADAYVDAASIYFTRLGGQSLTARLPLGWAPRESFEIASPAGEPRVPLTVSLGRVLDSNEIVACWDATTSTWRRLATGGSAGVTTMNVVNLGGFAIARLDLRTGAPAMPVVGAEVIGAEVVDLPLGTTAAIDPTPEVIFVEPGAHSIVTATVAPADTLPSGTPIEVLFAETYEYLDGATVVPPTIAQDFILYHDETNYRANYVVSPSRISGDRQLRRGSIRLDAMRPRRDGLNVVGPAGGTVSDADGVSVSIPQAALHSPIAVGIRRIRHAPTSVPDSLTYDFIAGVSLDAAGQSFGVPVELRVDVSGLANPNENFVWIRATNLEGATELEFVGLGERTGNTIRLSRSHLGLPGRGAYSDGSYFIYRLNSPVGFIVGNVTSERTPLSFVVTRTAELPFVGIVPAIDSVFALPARVGQSSVTAHESVSGRFGAAAAPIGTAGAVVIASITLRTPTFAVESVTPSAGRTAVSPSSAIRVRFSTQVNAASLTHDSYFLRDTLGNQVDVQRFMEGDRRTAVLLPDRPMEAGQRYTLTLTNQVQDSVGRPLSGNQPDGTYTSTFITAHSANGPSNASFGVGLSIPHSGATTVTGSAGSATPGARVVLRNTSTGVTVVVTAAADGSFSASIAALFSHRVEVLYLDELGNLVNLSSDPFRDADGTEVIGATGGQLTAGNGILLRLPAGAVPAGTPVRLRPLGRAELIAPLGGFLEFLGAAEINMPASVVASEELTLSVPAPAGFTSTGSGQILVFQELDGPSGTLFALINIGSLTPDGRVQTASPPFAGIRTAGKFVFAFSRSPINFSEMAFPINFTSGVSIAAQTLDTTLYSLASPSIRPFLPALIGVPFNIQLHDSQTNEVLLTMPVIPGLSPGFQVVEVPDPTHPEPILVARTFPADSAVGVSIQADIQLETTKEFSQRDPRPQIRLFAYTGTTLAQQPLSGLFITGEGARLAAGLNQSTLNAGRLLIWRPRSRLRFGTRYRVEVSGVCTHGNPAECATQNFEFSTAAPARVATVGNGPTGVLAPEGCSQHEDKYFSPFELHLVNDQYLAVANATISESSALSNCRGVVLMDVSDRAAPRVTSDYPLASRTLGITGIGNADFVAPDGSSFHGPAVLAISGDSFVYSVFHLLGITPDGQLTRRGGRLLTTSARDVMDGDRLPGVPPISGIPYDVAMVPNSDTALVATIGVGLQAVTLPDALQSRNVIPGLLRGDPTVVRAIEVNENGAGERASTRILVGDSNGVVIADAALNERVRIAGGVQDIVPLTRFSSDDNRNGFVEYEENADASSVSNEVRDIALFAAANGSVRLANFVRGSDSPDVVTMFGDLDVRRLSVDPLNRLLFAASRSRIYVLDVINPGAPIRSTVAFRPDSDGDGVDDRVLAILEPSVYGFVSISDIEISQDGSTLYVADAGAGDVKIIALDQACPILSIRATLFVDGEERRSAEFPGCARSPYIPEHWYRRPSDHLAVFHDDYLHSVGSGQTTTSQLQIELTALPAPQIDSGSLAQTWSAIQVYPEHAPIATIVGNGLSATIPDSSLRGGIIAVELRVSGREAGVPTGEVVTQGNVVMPFAGAELLHDLYADLIRLDRFVMQWRNLRRDAVLRCDPVNGANTDPTTLLYGAFVSVTCVPLIRDLWNYLYADENLDYTGVPLQVNVRNPVPRFAQYNDLSDAMPGFGGVATVGGVPLRTSKANNILYAFVMRRLGFSRLTIDAGALVPEFIEKFSISENPSAPLAYQLGVDLADRWGQDAAVRCPEQDNCAGMPTFEEFAAIASAEAIRRIADGDAQFDPRKKAAKLWPLNAMPDNIVDKNACAFGSSGQQFCRVGILQLSPPPQPTPTPTPSPPPPPVVQP